MVRKANAKKLKKSFWTTADRDSKRVAKFVRKGKTVTLVIRNEASVDGHNHGWVTRFQTGLAKRKVTPLWANW